MIIELLIALTLPLYVILFIICCDFLHVIEMTSDAENIVNDYEFYADTFNTPKDGVEQHRQQGQKLQTDKRIDKASNKTFNKTYAVYKQHNLNERSEKTQKVLGKDVISLHLSGVFSVVKIRNVRKLQ